jgi:nicotinamidase-related amidase
MQILRELKEIVNPAHTALIVVDPQCDFCSSEGFAGKLGLDLSRIQAAVPRLNKFVEECRKAGVMVVWIKEIYADKKMMPNVKAVWGIGGSTDNWIIKEGGPGIEWYKELTKPKSDEQIITKWNYDGFENTELDLLLRSNDIKTLLMTGFATNVCMETTARHGFVKGYYIVAVSDCTDSPSKHEYDAALFNIKVYFGKVATSDEIATHWK